MLNYKDPATVSNLTHNFFKDWPEDKSTFSTLKLGEKLYKIESMAFSYSNIKVLDLSDCCNLRVLSEHAFQQCVYLEHVILPKHITRLPQYAFFGLKRLKTVTGSNLTDFYSDTFEGCNRLNRIQIDPSFDSDRIYKLLDIILHYSEYDRGRTGILLGSDDDFTYYWSFTDFRFYFSKKVDNSFPDDLVTFYHDFENTISFENDGFCNIVRKSLFDYKAVSVKDFSYSFLNRKYFDEICKHNGKIIVKNKQTEAIEILRKKDYCETDDYKNVISQYIETVLDLDIEKLINSYRTTYDGELITKVGGDDTYYETINRGSFYSDPYIETILPGYYSYERHTGYTSNWGPSAIDLKQIEARDDKQKEFARANYNREKHIQYLIDYYYENIYENNKALETYLRIRFAKAIYSIFEKSGCSGVDLIKKMNSFILSVFP